MKDRKSLNLVPGWWKEERDAAKELVIKKPRKVKIEKFYTVKEVAAILRRNNIDYIYDLIREKKIDVQPDGGRYLISESALGEYLEQERMKVS